MFDLIIVGAGPAGLAAALYASRKRLNFFVLSKDMGGKSNYRVELPETDDHQIIRAEELVTVYRSRLEYLRHSYRMENVTDIQHSEGIFRVTTETGATEEARAVIIATGTRMSRTNVAGELKFLSKGLGYSSLSYSHLMEGKSVFVAGNTDRVLLSALELAAHAQTVTVALLKPGTYDHELVATVSSTKGVSVVTDVEIREFRGDEFAREVVISGADGEHVIAADGFFIEPEPIPNTEFLEGTANLTQEGYITVDAGNLASIPGLFAAGDVTGSGHEQILVALGDGAKAVLSAYRYLLKQGLSRE